MENRIELIKAQIEKLKIVTTFIITLSGGISTLLFAGKLSILKILLLIAGLILLGIFITIGLKIYAKIKKLEEEVI